MKWGWVLLGVLLTFGYLCWSEKGLEFPEYDGKDRVHQLTIKNYKSVMKRYDVMVIYYHKSVGEDRMSRKQFEVEELALEVRGKEWVGRSEWMYELGFRGPLGFKGNGVEFQSSLDMYQNSTLVKN